MFPACGAMTSHSARKCAGGKIVPGIRQTSGTALCRIRFQWKFRRIVRNDRKGGEVGMRFKETPLAELLKLIKEQKEQKRIREQMEKKQND